MAEDNRKSGRKGRPRRPDVFSLKILQTERTIAKRVKISTRGRREARTGNGKKKSSAIPYGQIYK